MWISKTKAKILDNPGQVKTINLSRQNLNHILKPGAQCGWLLSGHCGWFCFIKKLQWKLLFTSVDFLLCLDRLNIWIRFKIVTTDMDSISTYFNEGSLSRYLWVIYLKFYSCLEWIYMDHQSSMKSNTYYLKFSIPHLALLISIYYSHVSRLNLLFLSNIYLIIKLVHWVNFFKYWGNFFFELTKKQLIS